MPNLQRFLDAQASTYSGAHAELAAGRKRAHWMWFIFPQIHGLGSSPTARHYAIADLDEAAAYLAHPILSSRLRVCTALVNAIPDPSRDSSPSPYSSFLDRIFGFPDNLKFHSSITLFAEAAKSSSNPEDTVFRESLNLFFAGEPDQPTIARLQR